MDLIKKFAVVDSRLAKIDRKLGCLKARLYYQVEGQPLQELDIFSYTYKGRGSDSWKDGRGTDPQAEKYSVTANRLHWQEITKQDGYYLLQPEPGDELIQCTPESQVGQQSETTVKLELSSITQTNTYL